jgi:HEAT repeat protein
MIKRLSILCLAGTYVIAASGCGSDAANRVDTPSASTAGPTPPKRATVERQTPVTSTLSVPPDAFADVPEALDALAIALAESNQDKVRRAEMWLARQPSAAQPLADTLEDHSADLGLRIAVCRILARTGPSAKPILMKNLNNETQLVRLNAAKGLGSIRPTDEEIVQTLIDRLDDDDERMRLIAIQSLAHIGESARAAVPPLQEILNSKSNEMLRDAASQALKRINPRRTFND